MEQGPINEKENTDVENIDTSTVESILSPEQVTQLTGLTTSAIKRMIEMGVINDDKIKQAA